MKINVPTWEVGDVASHFIRPKGESDEKPKK